MRTKLKLDMEQLTVESFDTSNSQEQRGTVMGEQCTCPSACSCPGCPSCDATCPATCYNTCDDYSCANTCDGNCEVYSDACNSYAPCPTAQYTACGRLHCY